jgi:hypothetical protein
MSNFSIGDRVQVIGDIARYYSSTVGIITGIEQGVTSMFDKFTLRLADGAVGTFLAFQIHIPPATTARLVFDNSASWQPSGLRGAAQARHLRFTAQQFDIHIKILDSELGKGIVGQVFHGKSERIQPALVTLLVAGKPQQTATTDAIGEFKLNAVPSGEIGLEIFGATHRILAFLREG